MDEFGRKLFEEFNINIKAQRVVVDLNPVVMFSNKKLLSDINLSAKSRVFIMERLCVIGSEGDSSHSKNA